MKKDCDEGSHVGVIPQQMLVQSWYLLQFIYSVSRSSPANQIKKYSKSESYKLDQSNLCHDFPPTFPSFLFLETTGNT